MNIWTQSAEPSPKLYENYKMYSHNKETRSSTCNNCLNHMTCAIT